MGSLEELLEAKVPRDLRPMVDLLLADFKEASLIKNEIKLDEKKSLVALKSQVKFIFRSPLRVDGRPLLDPTSIDGKWTYTGGKLTVPLNQKNMPILTHLLNTC